MNRPSPSRRDQEVSARDWLRRLYAACGWTVSGSSVPRIFLMYSISARLSISGTVFSRTETSKVREYLYGLSLASVSGKSSGIILESIIWLFGGFQGIKIRNTD